MHQAGTKRIDDPSSGFIDEDTLFWLCSQTKLITTLIEQGKIELDTPVEKVLPELANPVIVTGTDDAGKLLTTHAKFKITFGQLLNHTSGLDYFVDGILPPSGLPLLYSHNYKGEDVSVFFKMLKGTLPGVPLKFEPGSDFAYGFSSDCAGFIVERLSGRSLEQYFQEYIFAPLGITSASFYLTPALKERLLPLSNRNADGTIETLNQHSYIEQDPANVTVHLGGGGLYSSQKDYLTILRHLLQIKLLITLAAGRAIHPILTLASVNKMFEPTVPPAGGASVNAVAAILNKYLDLPAGAAQFSRGLLFNTEDVPGKRRKGSGAWGGWANTSFFVDPTTGVAAVFATQLAPAFDDKHDQLFSLLEKELYSGLKA
ncbi:beta-lactamase/transpeptidase-like protein [Mycena rosella]|uniref:Beta-lactamase/transpeptidase-like protein n=1 Tax=Mycena rosella TaxID=1033263 RepID=A0AAD7DNL4_MYCRO|nr:beta-lactamase/transpeptidase-like protein [Mycena rosella]